MRKIKVLSLVLLLIAPLSAMAGGEWKKFAKAGYGYTPDKNSVFFFDNDPATANFTREESGHLAHLSVGLRHRTHYEDFTLTFEGALEHDSDPRKSGDNDLISGKAFMFYTDIEW